MKNPQGIGKRQLRAKALAAAVIDAATTGRTYEDIANEFYPKATAKRQTVYESIQCPGVQKALAEQIVEIEDSELKTRLLSFIRREKQDSLTLKALELGMRHKALLIDKSVQETRQLEPLQDLSSVSSEKLAEELTSRLKLSAQGLEMVKK